MKGKKDKNRKSVNPFKKGQKVRYHGKVYEVRRAYIYKGLPLCIIMSGRRERHMVSVNALKK